MITLGPTSISAASSAALAPAARTVSAASGADAAAASFGQIVDQLAADAIGTLKGGEAAALAGVQGKASVQQVVDSVMAAERTLQTMIALRDKAVQAYHEITSMAI
jgi:flagellar hook-basal body complex protein FliE